MRFVIVTGMSGAGKATALKILEDIGFFCVDNLPIPLITKFGQLASDSGGYDKVAVSLDIRNGVSGEHAQSLIKELIAQRIRPEVLFLEASDEVLVKRYKETRRTHPLAGGGRVEQGFEKERESLTFLKEHADFIIDTSTLLVRELKSQLEDIFVNNHSFKNFVVTVLSFGFKYGIPADADLVFDVRFLANPYYIPELKHLTGRDKEIREFVMKSEAAGEFLIKICDLLEFLIPNYIKEGKNGLVIGIGCTGGKHRSVTLATEIARALEAGEYAVKLDHRDIYK